MAEFDRGMAINLLLYGLDPEVVREVTELDINTLSDAELEDLMRHSGPRGGFITLGSTSPSDSNIVSAVEMTHISPRGRA